MPAKNIGHDAVIHALQKEGWTITHDPFYLQLGDVDLYVDLAAEKLLAAEKDGRKIAVEIKSFMAESQVAEFHNALGQFLNYRLALAAKEPGYILYLAVPNIVWRTFFQRQLPRMAVAQYQVKLIVYNVTKEEIEQWIN